MIRIDELAREIEARGYGSLWVPEHTHIPASRESPFPGGGELPREYAHMSDPFMNLAAGLSESNWEPPSHLSTNTIPSP